MIQRRRVPIVIWGPLTPWLQLADRFQNQKFKERYQELEAEQVAEKMKTHPTGVPHLTRAEVLYMVAQTNKELVGGGLSVNDRQQFFSRGTRIALDGFED